MKRPSIRGLLKFFPVSARRKTPQSDEGPIVLLEAKESLQSSNGLYSLLMQEDGNLVLYGSSGALWSSETSGSGAAFAKFQADGNFVLYSADSTPIWDTATNGHPSSMLVVQDDGNMVIYDESSIPIWSTGTQTS